MKSSLVVVALAAIAVIAVVVYVVKSPSPDNPLIAPPPSETTGTIPTPQYLFEHPDALKEAEQNCHDGGTPSSLYCSNVHRAESLRLADKYRRSLQPKGVTR
jgi:hypothetical protein